MQSLFVSLFILFTFIFSNGRSRYLLVKLDDGMFFTIYIYHLYYPYVSSVGFLIHSFYPISNSITAPRTKQEGEVCGSCFNANTNFDCGKCIVGLECVKDSRSELIPDLPSRCSRPNIGSIQPF